MGIMFINMKVKSIFLTSLFLCFYAVEQTTSVNAAANQGEQTAKADGPAVLNREFQGCYNRAHCSSRSPFALLARAKSLWIRRGERASEKELL